ncbi:MAG: membrane protein insertase YidC [Alphaproteobacteria bacterium GM7ARS4]|nr:membrane protein insertase YidC [Alphaproteobacteria bacterium GM7ARS4]
MAAILSFLILIAFDIYNNQQKRDVVPPPEPQPSLDNAPSLPRQQADQRQDSTQQTQAQTPSQTPCRPEQRIPIETEKISGGVSLCGGIIDHVQLKDHRTSLAADSAPITLLHPLESRNPYYMEHGWLTHHASSAPDNTTLWQSNDTTLTDSQPITLTWTSPDNIHYTHIIEVDDDYLFTITQKIDNRSDKPLHVAPYSLISRHGTPPTLDFFILHEGAVAYLDGELIEEGYADMRERQALTYEGRQGWMGLTDKYWLTALIPASDHTVHARFLSLPQPTQRYQADMVGTSLMVAPGDSVSHKSYGFAGAKELDIIESVEKRLHITHFDLAVDFGWFYFLTKPTFHLLNIFHAWFNNFGLAILFFTVLLRLLLYPLANKSFRAMHDLRLAQPEIQKIRERYASDKVKMNQELVAMYQKRQLQPAAGCLPMLVQLPIFFALYKVLFVSIEMRHQPFFGWVHDLSARDPTNIFTLFGLLPWQPPTWFHIGLWPIIMGVTMYLQQKMNPQPADPIQQKVFALLPPLVTIFTASFPAGLVIYWAWTNILSILQQYMLNRRLEKNTPMAGRVTKSS